MAHDGVVALALEGSQFSMGEVVSEPLSVKWGYELVFRALPDVTWRMLAKGKPQSRKVASQSSAAPWLPETPPALTNEAAPAGFLAL